MPEKSEERKASVEGFGFMHGFLASISVIIVSEIGDKTFFIAAIMAMKHSRYCRDCKLQGVSYKPLFTQ